MYSLGRMRTPFNVKSGVSHKNKGTSALYNEISAFTVYDHCIDVVSAIVVITNVAVQ